MKPAVDRVRSCNSGLQEPGGCSPAKVLVIFGSSSWFGDERASMNLTGPGEAGLTGDDEYWNLNNHMVMKSNNREIPGVWKGCLLESRGVFFTHSWD